MTSILPDTDGRVKIERPLLHVDVPGKPELDRIVKQSKKQDQPSGCEHRPFPSFAQPLGPQTLEVGLQDRLPAIGEETGTFFPQFR